MSPPENTKTEGADYVPPPGQFVNLMDLLTGDDWSILTSLMKSKRRN